MRNDDYLKGYSAAMKYAAEFARDAYADSQMRRCGEIMADHFHEKSDSEARAIALEQHMMAELLRAGADGLERLGIDLQAYKA